MQANHTPRIDTWYWIAILFASICGTNLGDLYAHESGLGIGWGLALLAVIAAIGFWLESRSGRVTEFYYWFVILIIRTGATNIADFLSFKLPIPGLPKPGPMFLWTLITAICIWLFGRRVAWSHDKDGQRAIANGNFWLAMLGAGTFGTVLGDICSHMIGGFIASIVLLPLLWAAWARWQKAPGSILLFWLAVAMARTAGTAVGDYLAEKHGLAIGLPISTILSGTAFIILVLYGQRARRSIA